MKRILAILCSVILVVTCCVMVGCSGGKFDMQLCVSYTNSISQQYQKVLLEYPVGTDEIDLILYDEKGKDQERFFDLSQVNGVSNGVLKWMDSGNVEDAGEVERKCIYYDQNGLLHEVIYNSDYGFKLGDYGNYVITFTVNAKENIDFRQSSRTVIVNITYLSTSVGGR